MADNILIPATGSGTATPNVRTDDVGGVHYQVVKLDVGGDGASTPVTSTGLPVTDAGGSLTVDGTVAVSGTVLARQTDGTNNLTTLIDADTGAGSQYVLPVSVRKAANGGSSEYGTSSDPFRVDPTGTTAQPVTDNAGSLTVDNPILSVVGGGTEAAAQRVTIANNSTGVLAVTDNGGTLSVDDGAGSLTIDNAALSVTGGGVEATALRVTVASDSTGVLSVDDNGASLTVDNPALSVTGGGVEATALRVTIASDSTGVLSVDDNGGLLSVDDGAGSLTVDNPTLSTTGGGVEAAALRVTIATDSTGVLSVDDNGASITVDNPALSVVGGGVEATAQRVTIASDSTGVLSVDDNGGSITVDGSVTVSGTTTTQDAADGLKDVAVPTYITQVGGSDGTYLHAFRTSAIGTLKVEVESMPALDLNGAENLSVVVEPGDQAFSVQGTPAGLPVVVSIAPNINAGNGWTPQAFYAVTTTVQTLKVTGGEIGAYYIDNPNATVAYVQFFDTNSSVTLGTTTPKWSLGIPGSSAANMHITGGVSFMYGIRVACTTTATGNTAPGSGLNLNFAYK